MELTQQGGIAPPIGAEAFAEEVPALLEPVLQETLTRHHIRLTDVGERFICLYGAVVVRRVSEGYPLADFSAEDVAQNVRDAARDLAGELQRLAGKPLSPAEEEWLCVHIAARQVQDVDPKPSAPTMTKRWSTTSCATSTASITTTCWTMPSCTPIC